MRLNDPTSGSVTCDGADLRELEPDDWRNQIAWVPQRAQLFAGTVADNIRLGAPRASAAQVRHAAEQVGAGELIDGLPEGMSTRLGEGSGRRLSAGQTHRIALARAFLRAEQSARLVVLDEPTAHLDERSAANMADAIARLARGRTTLLIVHHPALAARADRVLHIAAGRIGQIVAGPAGSPAEDSREPAPTIGMSAPTIEVAA